MPKWLSDTAPQNQPADGCGTS